jgi:hypothetical protein
MATATEPDPDRPEITDDDAEELRRAFGETGEDITMLPRALEDVLARRSKSARELDARGELISGEEQIRRLRAQSRLRRAG